MIKPQVLGNPLFLVKTGLVLVVTINGFILHKYIFPEVQKEVKKKHLSTIAMQSAAFFGSLSVVSWYSIVILATTKNLGYSVSGFLLTYFLALIIAYLSAIRIEAKRRDKC